MDAGAERNPISDRGLKRIRILGLANDLVFRDGFESGSTSAWTWDL